MKAGKRARPVDMQTGIREVLYGDWNPPGLEDLLPEDIRAHYILPIMQILCGSRSEQELLDFLHRTGAGLGGIAADEKAELDHLRPIAKKLLKLKL